MKESKFQNKLIDEIENRFEGAVVLKNDPNYKQGIPDLTIFYKDKWAMLEVKKSLKARKKPEPNQEYYIQKMNEMSFASFVYPENKEEVLDALERSFKRCTKRRTRISRSK